MTLHLSRRQTLAGLAVGAVSALALTDVTRGGFERHRAYLAAMRLAERLLFLLPDTRSAARIGATWQQRHPMLFDAAEILPQRLAARLKAYGWPDDSGGDGHSGGDLPDALESPHPLDVPNSLGVPDPLGVVVATIVRDEFERGEIEDIDGWRVSAFQAELCGLAYLVRSRPSLG